ncbi:MAG: ABC transporter substrate-binding protein [Candidatus Dormibacteria bacterium]
MQRLRFQRQGRQATGLLVGAIFLAACGTGGGSGSSTPSNGGDITYGAIVGLSGIFGPYGQSYIAGMNVAADKVNKNGGIVVDGKKYTLKMKYVDDRSDAQVALADGIQMFRDDHIKVLVGPLASEAVSMTPVAAQYNVINISLATQAPDLVGPKYPLLFAALPANNYRIGAMVAGIKHFYPGTKKVDFITGNGSNDTIVGPMTTQLQAVGITAGQFTYPPGTTDISTVASKVVADNPDLIVVGNSPQEEQSDVAQLDAAGLPKSVPCLCYSTELKPNGRPQLFPSAFSPVDPGVQSTPEIDAFKTAQTKYMNGATLQPFNVTLGLAYYFSVQLTALAMTKANSTTDVAAIAKAMTEVSDTEFGAKFQWSSNHTITVPLAVTQISGTGTSTVTQVTP